MIRFAWNFCALGALALGIAACGDEAHNDPLPQFDGGLRPDAADRTNEARFSGSGNGGLALGSAARRGWPGRGRVGSGFQTS